MSQENGSETLEKKKYGMGINLLTGLEMYNHPTDLFFAVIVDNQENPTKYGFVIERGPGHNHKPMLTLNPVLESQEEVCNALEELFENMHKLCQETLESKKTDFASSLITSLMKDDEGNPFPKRYILTKERTDEILKAMRSEVGGAATYDNSLPLFKTTDYPFECTYEELMEMSEETRDLLFNKAQEECKDFVEKYFSEHPELKWIVIAESTGNVILSGKTLEGPTHDELDKLAKERGMAVFMYSLPQLPPEIVQ